MTKSHTLRDELCHKLRLVGLTREETLPIVDQVYKQVGAEGPENVVKRLKVLKQAAMVQLAGGTPVFSWVSHRGSVPSGPWRPIWTKLLSSRYRQRRRAFNALMVYSSLCLGEREGPTPTQERKFMGSVSQSPARSERAALMGGYVLSGPGYPSGRAALDVACPDRSYLKHQGLLKEAPPLSLPYILRKKGVGKDGVNYADRQHSAFLGTDNFRPFHPFPRVLDALGSIGEDYFEMVHPYHNAYGDWKESSCYDDAPVGVVGSSQEPGMKFRAFASPNLVLQCAMEPLKAYLLAVLKTIRSDCTYDQSVGVRRVSSWLERGDTVYSVDLSDATNNFPLEYQMGVLDLIKVPEQDSRLFRLVATAPYRLMWDKERVVQWNVGQPLGAGPSFPLFALSHNLLAIQAGLWAGLTRDEVQDHFCVLGDDFVTNHEGLHNRYRALLMDLGCPISEQKCLESNKAAEFAGKFIMRDTIYHGFKYGSVSDHSFLDVIRCLGEQAISPSLLSAQQYKTASLLRSVPEPYGLGFNPHGIPLAVRYQAYLTMKDLVEVKPIKRVSTSELMNKFAYQVKSDNWRYLDAVHPRDTVVDLDPRLVTELHSPTSVEEWNREIPGSPMASLVSVSVPGGDPRPNQLIHRAERLEKVLSDVIDQNLTSPLHAPLGEIPEAVEEWNRLHPDVEDEDKTHDVSLGLQ